MKKFLYILLGIIVLYFLLAILGPKTVTVERQAEMQAPAAVIRELLTNYKTFHDVWSPWTEKDPAMAVTYGGTPGEPGHIYTWSGNDDVRTGTMSILAVTADTVSERITFGGEGDADLRFFIREGNGKTTVTWHMTFPVDIGRRPFMLFLPMDKWLGADFESGLSKLKNAAENRPATSTYQVEEIEWPACVYAGKREKLKLNAMSAFFGQTYGALLSDPSVKPASPPSAIYFAINGEGGDVDLSACVRVIEGSGTGKWEAFSVPSGKALKVAYYGPYGGVGAAHQAVMDYTKTRNLSTSFVIEEYVTDPVAEKDSSKWLTNVYYLVK